MRFGEAIDEYVDSPVVYRDLSNGVIDYRVLYEPELFRVKSSIVVVSTMLQNIYLRSINSGDDAKKLLKLSNNTPSYLDTTLFNVYMRAHFMDFSKNPFTKSDEWEIVWASEIKNKYESLNRKKAIDIEYGGIYTGSDLMKHDPTTIYRTYDILVGFKLVLATRNDKSGEDVTIIPRIPPIHKYDWVYNDSMFNETLARVISTNSPTIITVLDGNNVKGILLYTTIKQLLSQGNCIYADPNVNSIDPWDQSKLRFFELTFKYDDSKFYNQFVFLNDKPCYDMLSIISLKDLTKLITRDEGWDE